MTLKFDSFPLITEREAACCVLCCCFMVQSLSHIDNGSVSQSDWPWGGSGEIPPNKLVGGQTESPALACVYEFLSSDSVHTAHLARNEIFKVTGTDESVCG